MGLFHTFTRGALTALRAVRLLYTNVSQILFIFLNILQPDFFIIRNSRLRHDKLATTDLSEKKNRKNNRILYCTDEVFQMTGYL
jgi:hypothetical protein